MVEKNFELIKVLESPEKRVIIHKMVKKHIAIRLIMIVNIIENSVRFEVSWNTSKLKGVEKYSKVKDAIDYYNTL